MRGVWVGDGFHAEGVAQGAEKGDWGPGWARGAVRCGRDGGPRGRRRRCGRSPSGVRAAPVRGTGSLGANLQRELVLRRFGGGASVAPPAPLPLGCASEDLCMAGPGGAVADEVLAGEGGELVAVDAPLLHALPEPSAVLCDDGLSVSVASDDEGVAPWGSILT